jgi:hypothetical protein
MLGDTPVLALISTSAVGDTDASGVSAGGAGVSGC